MFTSVSQNSPIIAPITLKGNNKKKPDPGWGRISFGASDLTRTGDLLITSEMHYRLCYTSKLKYYNLNFLFCQLINKRKPVHFNF